MSEVELEKCGNCSRIIGKLETPHLFKQHVVCSDCIAKLNPSQVPQVTQAMPPQVNVYQAAPAAAPPRSYIGSAIITFLLYFVGFWIIGVIVNSVYLSSAAAEKKRTGIQPEGRGCLLALAWVMVGIPVLIFLLFLLGIIGSFHR